MNGLRTLDRVPEPAAGERAREIVASLLRGEGTETEQTGLIDELETLEPDPNVSDLVFWPDRHQLGPDLRRIGSSADVVAALAFRYRPVPL